MFGIDSSEFLVVALVALVVIGPKDLPKAMRVVGYWVGKARGVARQFREGFDNMVREAELEEMEKRWAAENERIMREHAAPAADVAVPADGEPAVGETPVLADQHAGHETDHRADQADQHADQPIMVEKPVVTAAPADHAAPKPEGAPS
ncbi:MULTISPECIES: Sec-independent protein translocase protein TatB [unclassified Sphingomonas]|uniref:Sec-independent protein translocase protein TatB n=1 Tax=unclassified Sphingomonas TaxID=196159 RepID=UPI00226987A8|nr:MULTISPECIES: Sec-independent protein translocase protein TatB [unclassified Sphingomonas]